MRSKMISILTLTIVAGSLAAVPVEAQRGGQPIQLPAGPGQEVVQARCTQCHGLNMITNSSGFSRNEWAVLSATMVTLSTSESAALSTYLATHYPPEPGSRPSLVSGDVKIQIKEWQVPTLGQRSRDPIEAPDGSIWWTGMWASLAGRLDPKTGEMKEFPLPPSARPHTIIADKDGSIWYTGNSNATIGKLDPRTGKITEYKTKSRDPHSVTWHPNGRLYFTAQGARMIGRLSPETGEITEVPTEPNPYGIQVGPDGRLWVAHNGTNKISSVNPDTLEIRYYEIPDASSRIRRLGLTSDGMVWYGNSTRGRIGRLNPATGEIKEWLSPSGPTSHPYAMAIVNDVIWYNESGMRPDTLVRFDPKTERFQSWPIPSGFGIIRNMWVTRSGDLLIHQSSSNRVGLVDIGGN